MATPIGHSLAGFVIFACYKKTTKIKEIGTIILFAFAANAPDLDFLPGFIIGQPNQYHHGISHSLGAAILFSIIAALFVSMVQKTNFFKIFFICLALYCSHLLLDIITADGRPPAGIPLLWPLSNEYYILSNPILPVIHHSSLDHATIKQFLEGVFSSHNLYVIFLEIILILPLLLVKILKVWKPKLLKYQQKYKANG